jgi:hypothetical protein
MNAETLIACAAQAPYTGFHPDFTVEVREEIAISPDLPGVTGHGA